MWQLINVILLTFVISLVTSENVIVIAPRSIRSNSIYRVSVATSGATLPMKFDIKIIERQEPLLNKTTLSYIQSEKNVTQDPRDFISTFAPFKTTSTIRQIDEYCFDTSTTITATRLLSVIVMPDLPKLVEFKIDNDIIPGSYVLDVEGFYDTTSVFRQQSLLYIESKTFSIHIQSDKAVYRPGDVVTYRILVLDADTKPIKVDQAMQVSVIDAGNDTLQQTLSVSALYGGYRGTFQIIEDHRLGIWFIEATYNFKTFRKSFEVAEYSVQKFQVAVQAPSTISKATKQLSVPVAVYYTFGKPVRGVMTVKASLVLKMDNTWSTLGTPITVTSVIYGSSTAAFNIADFNIPSDQRYYSILVQASVKEDVSDLIGQGFARTTLVDSLKTASNYKIFSEGFTFVLPGSPLVLKLRVGTEDGTALSTTLTAIKVTALFDAVATSALPTQSLQLDGSGKVQASIDVPATTVTSVNVVVQYEDTSESFTMLVKSLYVQTLTALPKLEETVMFRVGSLLKMKYISYYIVGRGNILQSSSLTVSDANTQDISIVSTFSMLPRCTVVVFYIDSSGKLFSDLTEVVFSQESMASKITIAVANRVLQPGKDLTLTITADKASYIGLSIIDQTTLLLKNGNDLNQNQIFNDLELYDNSGDIDYDDAFTDAYLNMLTPGTLLLTNALKLKSALITSGKLSTLRKKLGLDHVSKATALILIPVMPVTKYADLSDAAKKEMMLPDERVNFVDAPTWSEFISKDATTTVTTQLPDTMTSFHLTAFALSPINGLGITTTPIIVTTFRPLFIDYSLPYSVSQGDELKITVFIHNYFELNSRVLVTLVSTAGNFQILSESQVIKEVAPYSVDSTLFTIKATNVGLIRIKIEAGVDITTDTVQQLLLVKLRGATIQKTITHSTVMTGANVNENFEFTVPATIIADSLRTQLTFQGDIYSRELQNLEKSLIPFAYLTNVFTSSQTAVSQYKTDLLSALIKSLKLAFIKVCDNGGYPANLGCVQTNRNTFLTAYNTRNSGPVINLPEYTTSMAKSLDYLVSIQLADGSFPELGTNILTDVWLTGPRLTAYVLYSILVTSLPRTNYKTAIDKAVQNLLLQSSQLDSLTLTIFLRSLQELNHASKTDVFKLLDAKSSKNIVSKQWTQDLSKTEQAEMFVYILQAALVINDPVTVLQISNWITTSLVDNYYNPVSYLKSETVKALKQMITSYSTTNTKVSLLFAHESLSSETLIVNQNNKQWLQTYQIPPIARTVAIAATGTGYLSSELTYQYNLETTEILDQFVVTIGVVALPSISWQLNICASFKPITGRESAAVAVMEITFPGGFKTTDFVRDVDATTTKIKKKSIDNGNLIVEFENVNKDVACFVVPMYRKQSVIKALTGKVLIYDSQLITVRTTKTFTVPAFDFIYA